MNRKPLVRPWWLLPLGRIPPLWWVAIGVGLIGIEYLAGSYPQAPVFYVIPVTLAAWYSGRWPSLALAITMPLVHIGFLVASQAEGLSGLVAATLLRGGVILVMALWFARLSEHERALYRHVERLEGLLPICAFCKSIRTGAGNWETLETYISKRTEAQFSHGFCPTCGEEHYPDVDFGTPVSTDFHA